MFYTSKILKKIFLYIDFKINVKFMEIVGSLYKKMMKSCKKMLFKIKKEEKE